MSGRTQKNSTSAMAQDKTQKNTTGATEQTEEEAWTCEICKNVFSDPKARLLECQRCKLHYCIKCLNKTVSEYNVLEKSDSMWFCANCKMVVEKSIVMDLKIEERCKEIMIQYEDRITSLEDKMKSTCDEEKVRRIISEEINKTNGEEKIKEIVSEVIRKRNEEGGARSDEAQLGAAESRETPQVQDVINEINNRKAREKNIVIYGGKEAEIENSKERQESDNKLVEDILMYCDIGISESTVSKVVRLGKYQAPSLDPAPAPEESQGERPKKKVRPLLVTLESQEMKAPIFKNAAKLKGTEYDKVRIANDLTKEERAKEKELYEEAKKRETEELSGDYQFRVRGPPWARKVVRKKVQK